MKVADFQKYLRALADAVAAKTPANDLVEAANALAPFAHYKMEAFAEFLKLAEKKYGESGELPDGRLPKQKAEPKPKAAPKPKAPSKPKEPKPPKPTIDELLSLVNTLKVRIRTDQMMTKDGVILELAKFDKLTKDQLFSAVQRLGMQSKPKDKAEAMSRIVNHTVSAQAGIERSDA